MKDKIKVLLVEDDDFLSGMYLVKFNNENFKTIIAEDGLSGIEMAKEKLPDIILLDLMLPKMNGLDVLKKLKADKVTKNIPVVILSNLNKKDKIKKGMMLGAKDYLIKAHLIPAEVVDKIKKYI